MNGFVCGNLKIARDKLYRDPDDDGLNLINIDHFITGLQCVWVKRADQSSRDNWRIDIRSRSFGNCLIFNPRLVKDTDSKCMRAIACSYERFHKAFRNTDSNFRECFILENSDLIRGPADTGIINERFFSGNIPALNMEMVSKIKFTDLFRRENILSLDEISANLGIDLS
jgi:hypothetical protein